MLFLQASAPAAGKRPRLPTALAMLALAWHLLVPGLCLAQMLSAAPLGAICSVATASNAAGTSSLPDAGVAGHALDNCGHCLSASAVIIDSAPHHPALAFLSHRPAWQSQPAGIALQNDWRPPPRGPPSAA